MQTEEVGVERPSSCPLCRLRRATRFIQAHGRQYFECGECGLIHLAPENRLGLAAERAHYGTHENDPADARYRAFLSRLTDPLLQHLRKGAEGLDYGSGPGPALAPMLRDRGFQMALYDPFFAPDPRALQRAYEFITCTETIEHFFCPGDEFDRLRSLLRPYGWLGVMTEVLNEGQPFEGWWYARDPTHVSFYRPETLEWIATRWGASLERPHPNVALFRKPAS